MGGHCICHLGERERTIRPGEQPVGAEALRPGTLGDVVYVLLPFSEGVRAALNGSCDELQGILTGRGVEIVFLLKHSPGGRKVPEELLGLLLLFPSSGQSGLARVKPVHTLTGGDVADIVLPVGRRVLLVRLKVGTFSICAW